MFKRKAQVVFDGNCGFCRANRVWMERLDWYHCLEGVPYQEPSLSIRFPNLDVAACTRAVHVVFPDGRMAQGGDAVRAILLRLPLLALAGVILSIPPFPGLLRKLYPWIARNRKRFSR